MSDKKNIESVIQRLEYCEASFDELGMQSSARGCKLAAKTIARLQAEKESLQKELDAMKRDIKEAAGELLLPIPEPGTDMAKLMLANILMRKYQIPELCAERDRLWEALQQAQDSFRDGNDSQGFGILFAALSHPANEEEKPGVTIDTIREEEKESQEELWREADAIFLEAWQEAHMKSKVGGMAAHNQEANEAGYRAVSEEFTITRNKPQ